MDPATTTPASRSASDLIGAVLRIVVGAADGGDHRRRRALMRRQNAPTSRPAGSFMRAVTEHDIHQHDADRGIGERVGEGLRSRTAGSIIGWGRPRVNSSAPRSISL